MARNPGLWHDSAVVLERLAAELWTQTAPPRVPALLKAALTWL